MFALCLKPNEKVTCLRAIYTCRNAVGNREKVISVVLRYSTILHQIKRELRFANVIGKRSIQAELRFVIPS
jgi:hypothetical protein